MQNAAARLIVQRKKCESIRNDIINLHWLRINERIVFKILITVFKCLHDMAPFDLCTLLDIKDPQNLTLNYVVLDKEVSVILHQSFGIKYHKIYGLVLV